MASDHEFVIRIEARYAFWCREQNILLVPYLKYGTSNFHTSSIHVQYLPPPPLLPPITESILTLPLVTILGTTMHVLYSFLPPAVGAFKHADSSRRGVRMRSPYLLLAWVFSEGVSVHTNLRHSKHTRAQLRALAKPTLDRSQQSRRDCG